MTTSILMRSDLVIVLPYSNRISFFGKMHITIISRVLFMQQLYSPDMQITLRLIGRKTNSTKCIYKPFENETCSHRMQFTKVPFTWVLTSMEYIVQCIFRPPFAFFWFNSFQLKLVSYIIIFSLLQYFKSIEIFSSIIIFWVNHYKKFRNHVWRLCCRNKSLKFIFITSQISTYFLYLSSTIVFNKFGVNFNPTNSQAFKKISSVT